jgi:hypothetical protein
MRLLLALAGLTCALPAAQEKEPAAVNSVEAAARARQEAVKTADVVYLVTQVIPRGGISSASRGSWRDIPAQETTLESTCRLVLDGGKVRYEKRDFIEVAGRFHEVLSLTTFDGSTSKLLFPEGMGRTRNAGGLISDKRQLQEGSTHHFVPLRLAFRGVMEHFAIIPLAKLKPTGATLMIDGTPCQEYAYARSEKSRELIWVDPARGYIVRRMKSLTDGKPHTQYDIDYRKEAGVWVPTNWAYQQFSPKGDVLKTVKAEVLRMRLNEPQPAERFDLTFPPGTFVYDETSGKEYRIKPDGSRREFVPVRRPAPPPPARRDMWVPVTLGVLLALLAGCWYLVRRQRRRPA